MEKRESHKPNGTVTPEDYHNTSNLPTSTEQTTQLAGSSTSNGATNTEKLRSLLPAMQGAGARSFLQTKAELACTEGRHPNHATLIEKVLLIQELQRSTGLRPENRLDKTEIEHMARSIRWPDGTTIDQYRYCIDLFIAGQLQDEDGKRLNPNTYQVFSRQYFYEFIGAAARKVSESNKWARENREEKEVERSQIEQLLPELQHRLNTWGFYRQARNLSKENRTAYLRSRKQLTPMYFRTLIEVGAHHQSEEQRRQNENQAAVTLTARAKEEAFTKAKKTGLPIDKVIEYPTTAIDRAADSIGFAQAVDQELTDQELAEALGVDKILYQQDGIQPKKEWLRADVDRIEAGDTEGMSQSHIYLTAYYWTL